MAASLPGIQFSFPVIPKEGQRAQAFRRADYGSPQYGSFGTYKRYLMPSSSAYILPLQSDHSGLRTQYRHLLVTQHPASLLAHLHSAGAQTMLLPMIKE